MSSVGKPRGVMAAVFVAVILAVPGCLVLPGALAPTRDDIVIWGYRGDGFYGVVSHGGSRPATHIRSDDGGATWVKVSAAPEDRVPRGFYSDIEKCAADGVCYRYNEEGLVLERGSADLGWEVELTVPGPRELACLDVNPHDSGQVVVQVSDDEIAYRMPTGSWRTVNVVEMTR